MKRRAREEVAYVFMKINLVWQIILVVFLVCKFAATLFQMKQAASDTYAYGQSQRNLTDCVLLAILFLLIFK